MVAKALLRAQCLVYPLLLGCLLLPGCVTKPPLIFTEGEWQFSNTQPASSRFMPPTSIRYHQCLSLTQVYPAQYNKPSCQITQTIDGQRVAWQVRCVQAGQASVVQGDFLFSDITMHGTIRIEKDGATTINQVVGRYVGSCAQP